MASGTPTTTSTTTSAPTITTNAAGQTIYTYQMPASSTPTNCFVALHGHDAILAYHSNTLDVSPACASWVQSSAASGELWDQITGGFAAGTLSTVCTLSGSNGQVTATVLDSGEEVYGQEACTRLLSAGGWTEQVPSTTTGG
ncbi:MAG TPA: hypothetical protein VMD09_18345 [Solirubrobacteraceae bacterium]|nr:hypothetical protein [Solirubrobacteraceae bacterium]